MAVLLRLCCGLVVALSLTHGAHAWTPVGALENPRNNSSQSGMVSFQAGFVMHSTSTFKLMAYPTYPPRGTERLDTAEVCGDTYNGFGLLFNWNLLGDGAHTIVVIVDGVELDRSTITVTTLGEEFPEGLEGEYILEGFPDPDTSVVIR